MLQSTEQYIRSISTAMEELETNSLCFPEEDTDGCGDEFNRMLLFFCNLLGGLGLCRAYVMKSAKERSRSADRQLSIRDLKAVAKRRKPSGVKSSPFKASSSFFVTPVGY